MVMTGRCCLCERVCKKVGFWNNFDNQSGEFEWSISLPSGYTIERNIDAEGIFTEDMGSLFIGFGSNDPAVDFPDVNASDVSVWLSSQRTLIIVGDPLGDRTGYPQLTDTYALRTFMRDIGCGIWWHQVMLGPQPSGDPSTAAVGPYPVASHYLTEGCTEFYINNAGFLNYGQPTQDQHTILSVGAARDVIRMQDLPSGGRVIFIMNREFFTHEEAVNYDNAKFLENILRTQQCGASGDRCTGCTGLVPNDIEVTVSGITSSRPTNSTCVDNNVFLPLFSFYWGPSPSGRLYQYKITNLFKSKDPADWNGVNTLSRATRAPKESTCIWRHFIYRIVEYRWSFDWQNEDIWNSNVEVVRVYEPSISPTTHAIGRRIPLPQPSQYESGAVDYGLQITASSHYDSEAGWYLKLGFNVKSWLANFNEREGPPGHTYHRLYNPPPPGVDVGTDSGILRRYWGGGGALYTLNDPNILRGGRWDTRRRNPFVGSASGLPRVPGSAECPPYVGNTEGSFWSNTYFYFAPYTCENLKNNDSVTAYLNDYALTGAAVRDSRFTTLLVENDLELPDSVEFSFQYQQ